MTPFAAGEFRAGFVDISVLPTSARFGRGRLSRGGLKVKSHRACTEPTILEGPWDIAGSFRMLDDGVKTML